MLLHKFNWKSMPHKKRSHIQMHSAGQSLFVALLFSIQWAVGVVPVAAQKESVNPGINKQFENPNVTDFIGRFEREGRDSFDHPSLSSCHGAC